MSVLKLKYVLSVLLAAMLCVAAQLSAQYDPVEAGIDSLTVKIDSQVVLQGTLAELRAGMLVRSSRLSARIDRLREGGGGPLDKYRLNSALAVSQSLADSIDLVNARLDGIQQEIDGLRLDAVAACTAALDSLSRLMKDSPAGPSGMLARRFDRLRERRQRLASADGDLEWKGQKGQDGGESRILLADLAGLVEIRPQDSPEEIAEKSAFLTDIAVRWRRALEALEHSIVRLDEERAMRSRMGEFTQELALFDEIGPSSRAAVPGEVSTEQNRTDDGVRQPVFEQSNDFADISSSTGEMAEGLSLDIQLTDPEAELRLMQELDRFSADDMTGLANLLRAQRDSLAADLDSLRELHELLSRKTDLD